jgi:hypothetical protein
MAQRLNAASLTLVLAVLGNAAALAGNLENPQPGGRESGIGIVSGWFCSAERIDIEIDGAMLYRAAYGTARADTQSTCGRSDTGFAVLINWNTLGAGQHLVRALADGVEFARATATVVTLGGEFLQGKSATLRLDNFPDSGKGVMLEWQESKQNFVIRDFLPTLPPVTAPSINGTMYGPVLEQVSNCSNAVYNGNHGANAIWSVSMFDNVNLNINGNIQTAPPFNCSYTGTHAQSGATHSASGTFTCDNGKKGNWRATDMTITDRGITLIGDGNWSQQGLSCQMKFLIGGFRHLPLP